MSARILTTIVRADDRRSATTETLRAQRPALLEDKRWPEAELIGLRLLSSARCDVPDFMAYFDARVGQGDRAMAFGFLRSLEKSRPAADLPKFRFRAAEKMIETAPSDPRVVSDAIDLLRQSLAGGLPKQDDYGARRLLASQAYASHEYDRAIDLLKPLEQESVDAAVEIVWTRWIRGIDGDTAQIRSDANSLFDELLRQVSQRKKFRLVNPTPQELTDFQMLLVILGRESEFFDIVRELIVMSPAEKDAAKARIDEFRLNAESRRKSPNLGVVSEILTRRLENDPNDALALQQAVRLWARLPADSGQPIAKWVDARLKAQPADLSLLHFAGDLCRNEARWTDARSIYARILESAPGDYVAMNNLAESLYKTKPFDYTQALELTEKALRISPGNVAILETRGQLLARLGKLEESREILESCLASYPQDWNLRNTLVQIYERKGDQANAEAHRQALSQLERPPGAEPFAQLP